jgi:hypothetical protein
MAGLRSIARVPVMIRVGGNVASTSGWKPGQALGSRLSTLAKQQRVMSTGGPPSAGGGAAEFSRPAHWWN